jgi:hypothetical protein
MLRGVRSLLSDAGFQIALVISALGTVVVVATRRFSWRVPFGAVVLVAVLVAMRVDLRLEWRLVIGVVLLAVAGAAGSGWVFDTGRVLGILAMLGGAVLVATSMTNVSTWWRVVGFVVIVVAVPASGVVDRRSARVVPLLFLLAAIGVYVCAPDTEYTKPLLGALIPVALLVFDASLRAAAPTGAVAAVVVWTAFVEGRGRPGAVVGGLACLAVVLLVAATRWRWRRVGDVVLLLGIDLVAVVYVARLAGFRQSAWTAALLAVPALVLTWVALLLVSGRRAEPRR